jgi:predicted ATPase
MITNISIRGFKSLSDVQNLELGKVNVFIGANGSGKTNLLEAIGFLGAAASGVVDDQSLLRRGVRLSPPALYKSSFNGNSGFRFIEFQAEWAKEETLLTYQVKFTSVLEPQKQYFFDVSIKEIGKEPWYYPPMVPSYGQREVKHAVELLDTLADYAVFSPNTPMLRGVEPDTAQRIPVGLGGGQLAEATQELISKKDFFGNMDIDDIFGLFEWIEGLDIVHPSRQIVSSSVPTKSNIIRFTDRWMLKGHNHISAYDASEGALYVLFMLVLAMHPKSPRFFAIENPDQTMHPRLARAMMRLFCKQLLHVDPPRQVLITTHNPLVLDGLDLRNEQIRLFAVERDMHGATRIYRVQVSDEIIEEADKNGLSLSNLWVMGRLGGVSDLF